MIHTPEVLYAPWLAPGEWPVQQGPDGKIPDVQDPAYVVYVTLFLILLIFCLVSVLQSPVRWLHRLRRL